MEVRRCMKCMTELKPGETVCPECGQVYGNCKTESFALKPGTILDGKYLVGEMLGQGGFGITYIGFDLLLEQKVAIKEYFPMSTGMVSRESSTTVVWSSAMMAKTGVEKGFDSFLKEARKMAKLRGIPGVVGVNSVFIQNETAYIVMDFIEGETLQKKLEREGPMEFDICVKLLTPIMQALAEVHKHGIIHRDISPDNIMVQKDGNLILLDLGAAKDLDIQSADGTVQSSQMVAKHGFSPIEQYGRNGRTGPWTDVYAMAATIYFCCTGKLLPSAVDRVVDDTLVCQPLLTQAQFNALAFCMTILPEKRPQDMNVMLRIITNPFESEKKERPKPVPPKPKPQKSPKSGRTKPGAGVSKWLVCVIAGIAVLCIAIAISTGRPSGAAPATDALEAAETTVPPASAAIEVPATDAPAATEATLEPVTLKMWFHGSNVTPDASAKVMEEVNAYLKDKINVTLEPIWGTWGDFDQATVTALAGGDKVDMYFTCNWSADEYNKYAKDGYWVKLDDLLPTYAPELLETIPQGIWDCAVTNGYDGQGIYAVPGLKDTAAQNCWDVNGTLLAELGYDVDAVCAAGLDYYSDEFAEMMQAAKDLKGKNFYPLLIEPAVLERMVTHSSIITGDLASGSVLSYYYDAEHPSKDLGNTIVNKFSTDEFAKFAAKTYEYAQKGFISPSCQSIATANNYRTATQSTGAYLFGTQSYAYGCEIEFAAARGIDVRMVPETAAYMDCTSGQGAMIAISATSANPERALMFLNLLNTEPELMTMMNYGIEGFTYEKNADGTITFIEENRATYSPWRNGMGNVRILPPTAAEGLTYWDDFAAYYDAAEVLPMGGFIFDSSELGTEAAAISNVYAEFAFNLLSGAVNPATELPKFLEKLNAAGINAIVDAANEQLVAYMG